MLVAGIQIQPRVYTKIFLRKEITIEECTTQKTFFNNSQLHLDREPNMLHSQQQQENLL